MPPPCLSLFKKFDADADGFLSLSELEQFYSCAKTLQLTTSKKASWAPHVNEWRSCPRCFRAGVHCACRENVKKARPPPSTLKYPCV